MLDLAFSSYFYSIELVETVLQFCRIYFIEGKSFILFYLSYVLLVCFRGEGLDGVFVSFWARERSAGAKAKWGGFRLAQNGGWEGSCNRIDIESAPG